jgi:hypothetical protein
LREGVTKTGNLQENREPIAERFQSRGVHPRGKVTKKADSRNKTLAHFEQKSVEITLLLRIIEKVR